MDQREELIRIQKRLVKRLKEEIRHYVREDTPILQKYRDEYEREVRRYARIATQRELIEAVKDSDIVYCGDYHTLAQSQRTPIKILEQVVKERKEIILCLEVVMIKHQKHLDDFIAGRISEAEFLKRIDYAHTWGFLWNRYKIIFDFVKKEKIGAVAINSEPRGIERRLLERDRKAAEVIVGQTKSHPSALIFVLDGDWHIAQSHLPYQVELLLKREKLTRKTLTIFQNAEKIYWQLVNRRLEHRVDVVQLSKGKYCIINTTPTVRLRSYLNWAEDEDELSYATLWKSEQSTTSIEDEIIMIINTITDFLKLPKKEGMDEFSVYSSTDLDFLETLINRRQFSYPEIQEIKQQIESDESYYIKKGHIIYLSNLSINHAAEEATHFINHILAGEFASFDDPKEVFYLKTVAECLGFLGSKIVNQKRKCYTEDDFRYFARQYARKKKPDPELKTLHTAAKYILKHRKVEFLAFKKGVSELAVPFILQLLEEPMPVQNAVTHSLGYLLGNGLYYGLVKNRISRETVASLFFENFKKNKPSSVYFEISKLLQKAKTFNISEDSRDVLSEDITLSA